MIPLRTLTGKKFYLNNEMILRIDVEFDTLITLSDHKTLWVMDTPEEIRNEITKYKKEIMNINWGENDEA